MSTGEIIDVVLAFVIPQDERKAAFDVAGVAEREEEDDDSSAVKMKRRVYFEAHLQNQGILIEREISEDGNVFFVKLHASFDFLCRMAEKTKLPMPIKVG